VTRLRVAGAAMAAVLLMGTVPTPAQAYDYFGAGTLSCGQWLGDRQSASPQHVLNESWVLGFVSGVNSGAGGFGLSRLSNAGEDTDAAGMFAWLDNYCRAHPLEKLVGATEQLWLALQKPVSK
jgi:hypothetical protein